MLFFFFSCFTPFAAHRLALLNCFIWFQLPATPLQVNMMKTESGTLIQYVNNLYSLNEGIFSVAQSLFAHVCVGQTYLHTDTQTHGLAKPISVNQAYAWFKNSIHACSNITHRQKHGLSYIYHLFG